MKAIAVIVVMLLCGIGVGYEVGDRVYILEENVFGDVDNRLIGNITSIDDLFICVSNPIYVNSKDELIPTGDVEACLKLEKIAAIRVF